MFPVPKSHVNNATSCKIQWEVKVRYLARVLQKQNCMDYHPLTVTNFLQRFVLDTTVLPFGIASENMKFTLTDFPPHKNCMESPGKTSNFIVVTKHSWWNCTMYIGIIITFFVAYLKNLPYNVASHTNSQCKAKETFLCTGYINTGLCRKMQSTAFFLGLGTWMDSIRILLRGIFLWHLWLLKGALILSGTHLQCISQMKPGAFNKVWPSRICSNMNWVYFNQPIC